MGKTKIRSLILVILLTLLITCIPSSGFAEGDSLDETIQRIKTLFEIGEDYVHFYEYEYDYPNGEKIKVLSWSNENGNINVTIDEEGNIISYSKNEYSSYRQLRIYKFPKITKEQGEKIAKDFIKKLYPDILDKIELIDEEELYDIYRREDLSGYNYNFIMIENDIPFKENSLYVSVDTQTGEVISFNINWEEDLEFPDANGIISKDEAKEIYKDNINLELAYRVKEDKDMKSYLGYKIKDTEKTVDAKTKDMLSTSYKSAYYVYGSTSGQYLESLSNEEINQLIDSEKIISRQEVSEKILDGFKLGEGYEIQDHKLKANKEKDLYIWEVMVVKHDKNGSTGVSGRIDAKTGEIIDFSDPGSWDGELGEPKYSKEELLKKAIEIIKNNSHEKYEEVEYVEDENEDSNYTQNNMSNFLFIRKVNDIRVENEGFMMALDNTMGNVLTYSYNWNHLEFESPDNIIEEDRVKEILLEDKELELEYQTVKEDEEKKNVKLVYDFKDKYLIVDAKTGEVIDTRKELMEKEGIKEYKDIENSYAKDQIRKLQNYIYLFEGDEFKPKQAITQKEFFQLLAQIMDVYLHDDLNYLYERFINQGILKEEEKNMEAKITREEAIKYVIRAFGQEPLEDIGDIYKIDYEDADEISVNLKGHIAIAKGLGFISGKGNFRPKDNLTREEAAIIIYNILSR